MIILATEHQLKWVEQMATKLTNMNKGAHDIASSAFKKLLIAGAFPEVDYKEVPGMYGGISTSYSMMDYSTRWSQFSKVVQKKLITDGFEFGLWQNARNSKYICAVEDAVSGITEDEVNECSDRFRTMFD